MSIIAFYFNSVCHNDLLVKKKDADKVEGKSASIAKKYLKHYWVSVFKSPDSFYM